MNARDKDNDNKDVFRPTHNPYIVGNPIKDKTMFFGREEEFSFIRQKVTGGKKGGLLVLCGTRRSGKTSILFQIMNGRLGPDFFPVLIDMQAMTVTSDLDFLVKLASAILDAVGDPDLSVKTDLIEKQGSDPMTDFQQLIKRAIGRLEGRKLVLLFDEYEIFESYIDQKLVSTEVLNLFSNWIDHMEGVFIIFTGSDKIEERKADYWERFLPKAVHYQRISFLGKSDTMRLIKDPLKDIIHYEKGLPQRIYVLTSGQPFYTQVFCQALVDNLNERQTYKVTYTDLQEVIDHVIENPLPQMIFSWNSLTNLEKLALSLIGEICKDGSKPVKANDIVRYAQKARIGYRLDPALLNETLEKLFHHDMLNKDSEADTYTFKMDLWRLWIIRMHSKWKVIDEIKSDERGLGEGITRQVGRTYRAALMGVILLPLLAAAGIIYFNGSGSKTASAPSTRAVDSTWVTIRTEPPGADVILGNQILGKTPINHKRMPVSTEPLRIQMAGYKSVADTLALAKDVEATRDFTLAEKTGRLRLTTAPPGAKIHINGTDTGRRTPATVEDLSVNDTYEVRFVLSGYNPASAFGVKVLEDSTIAIHRAFSRSTSQVQILSDPAGATVYLDNDLVGQTPSVHQITHGTHRLQVVMDGYAQEEREVRVPVSGNRIHFTLNQLPPGRLVVGVVPWADVWIDGELKGPQKQRYATALPPGTYRIRLVNPNYETEQRTVEIRSGKPTELRISLKPKEEP